MKSYPQFRQIVDIKLDRFSAREQRERKKRAKIERLRNLARFSNNHLIFTLELLTGGTDE